MKKDENTIIYPLKRKPFRYSLYKEFKDSYSTIKVEVWPNGKVLLFDGTEDGNHYDVFDNFNDMLKYFSNNYSL